VREYAVRLEVNSNTAFKAFEELSRSGIIYNRRGMGYFVTAGARGRIVEMRRKEFYRDWLPELFRHMDLLNIPMEELVEAWKNREHTPYSAENA